MQIKVLLCSTVTNDILSYILRIVVWLKQMKRVQTIRINTNKLSVSGRGATGYTARFFVVRCVEYHSTIPVWHSEQLMETVMHHK